MPDSVDSLLKLILFLECVTPSANLVLVVCQQAGNFEAAETLSLGYIMMYVVMLLTMVGYLTLAINIIY